MSEYKQFKFECIEEIEKMAADAEFGALSANWMKAAAKNKYTYHFEYMGRPIIQQPQDIVAIQELIWEVKPDLIIETGIAHGGSLIMSASMLAQIDVCEAIERGEMLNPCESNRKVIGIDIDIREHNKLAIENHPMSSRITMIQGSSIDKDIVTQVKELASSYNKILVLLDSNHTHAHVLEELEAYAPLVSEGSYCIVFDTIIQDLPNDIYPDRPWGVGDNPKTAVWEYLKGHDDFEIDTIREAKLQLTVAPDGFLKRKSKLD